MAELKFPELISVAAPSVAVSLKYLKNLGDFNNVTLFMSVSDSVRPDETNQIALQRVLADVDAQMEVALKELD